MATKRESHFLPSQLQQYSVSVSKKKKKTTPIFKGEGGRVAWGHATFDFSKILLLFLV